ncbi:hypothetical protein IE53DRAFT_390700 [Violaceomyces palustris]|uniref:Uncharacterized protein n=1 Tax=Violaceomyces palustris TaxID=1673888 RepID=A0ACD0NMX2_9BASI|nr:hypothetical protein IE53DRAFT_390700 [Violaceomyces palustris]
MINHIARRTFTTRSAIRAPPAPTISINLASSGLRPSAGRRVAMLPKASSDPTPPLTVSSLINKNNEDPQDEIIQVGNVSSNGDGSKVVRIGDSI